MILRHERRHYPQDLSTGGSLKQITAFFVLLLETIAYI